MTNRATAWFLRKGLGGFFLISAVFKMLSTDYLTGLIFSLVPVQWIGWLSSDLIITALIVVIIAELLLGTLLWRGIYLTNALTTAIIFLMLMSLLNSYQLWAGIADCGCLGRWISIPPEVAIAKTLVLLGITIFLKFTHQEFGKKSILSSYQSQ